MKSINKLNQKQIKELHKLYKNEWWSKDRSLEETKEVVKNSTLIFAIVDESDNLIAFARVLSDFLFKALIFDVIVDKSYRGQKLGERIVKEILEYNKLRGVKSFELYCLDEMKSFYEKFGFSEYKDLKLMNLKNKH